MFKHHKWLILLFLIFSIFIQQTPILSNTYQHEEYEAQEDNGNQENQEEEFSPKLSDGKHFECIEMTRELGYKGELKRNTFFLYGKLLHKKGQHRKTLKLLRCAAYYYDIITDSLFSIKKEIYFKIKNKFQSKFLINYLFKTFLRDRFLCD